MIDLRAARKRRGLTQTELASLLGVSQARISEIENRPELVALGQVAQVLAALGYKVGLSEDKDWTAPVRKLNSYVYVIPHRGLPAIKIGKANDVEVRAAFLGDVDLEAGIYLTGDSERVALSAESLLHKAFRKWRLPPEMARHIGVGYDGSTEWFDIACLPRVRKFISANHDLIGMKAQHYSEGIAITQER